MLMVSLYSITFAVFLFVMPMIYHHTQYPYKDIEKFKMRAHCFIKVGVIPGAVTVFRFTTRVKIYFEYWCRYRIWKLCIYSCTSSIHICLYNLRTKIKILDILTKIITNIYCLNSYRLTWISFIKSFHNIVIYNN